MKLLVVGGWPLADDSPSSLSREEAKAGGNENQEVVCGLWFAVNH